MADSETIITISDVLEYLFCPRFIYYMHCLDIPQHEESRFKVMKGREVHEKKLITNPDYLRKKLGVVKKEMNVFVASKQHHIKGIIDEVLILDDGTAAPLITICGVQGYDLPDLQVPTGAPRDHDQGKLSSRCEPGFHLLYQE